MRLSGVFRILCCGMALAAFCHPLSAQKGGSVIGALGQPLGSREVITGVMPEHPPMISNPMAVSEVNGSTLTNAITIEIRGAIRIETGVTYRLEGYESGGYEGSPDWAAPGVQQPFQWRSFFVVTKVIDPKPK